MKLLLIEDHKDIAGVIFDYFEIKGYTLDYANNGQQGLALCSEHHYDVIILDIMLPKINGLDLCKSLREDGIDTPVLMLTARDNQQDVLDGFDHGADDYLIKPFDLRILEARVQALYRRKEGHVAAKSLVFQDLILDLKNCVAKRNGVILPLNQTQFKILKILMMNAPNLVSRDDIVSTIWPDEAPEGDLLRSHIYQLRGLIDKPFTEYYLRTVPKKGYRLVSDNKT